RVIPGNAGPSVGGAVSGGDQLLLLLIPATTATRRAIPMAIQTALLMTYSRGVVMRVGWGWGEWALGDMGVG
ncbi:hypothetical protein, partial [Streptomyces sp. NPDC058653]|uniref:hypothetical protein n=1 Tax=Streptomyces sp. NPDC058653 TaxID=3346576 RepID=UPI00365D07C1